MMSNPFRLSIAPTEIWLEIPETAIQAAKAKSLGFTTPEAQFTVWLHSLVENTLLPWIQSEWECTPKSVTHQCQLWPLVEGLVILAPHHRLIFLPTVVTDRIDLSVPQEWVDLVGWQGDIFVPVEVYLEEGSLGLWGFADWHQLKTNGTYHAATRIYHLAGEALTQDLAILEATLDLALRPQPYTGGLTPAPLSVATAQPLVSYLTDPAIYPPRRAIPFTQWADLISDPRWRHQLQQHWVIKDRFPLRDWFSGNIQPGWLDLITLESQGLMSPALAVRQGQSSRSTLQRGKCFTFQHDSGDSDSIYLIITVTPLEDQRYNLLLQVFPCNDTYLPANLYVQLLDESGEVLHQVQSRSHDNWIQLPQLKGIVGERFQIKMGLNTQALTEAFMI